jgi:hypothetical protein
MSRHYTTSKLSRVIDSVSDSETQYADGDTIMSQDATIDAVAPVKRGRGRPKGSVNKVMKTKATGQRRSGGSITASRKNVAKRTVLKEKANEQCTTEIDNVNEMEGDTDMVDAQDTSADELDESIVAVQPAKRGRPRKAARPEARPPIKERIEYSIQDSVCRGERAQKMIPKPLPTKAVVENRQASVESRGRYKNVPETLQSFAIIDQYGDEDVGEPTPRPIIRQTSRARSLSRPRQQSDTDRGPSEPATRRKLGELKKKLENLELKYNSLQEIGIKEAEVNYEKLRKHTDERAKGMFYISVSKPPADIHQLPMISLHLSNPIFQHSLRLQKSPVPSENRFRPKMPNLLH